MKKNLDRFDGKRFSLTIIHTNKNIICIQLFAFVSSQTSKTRSVANKVSIWDILLFWLY